MFIKQTCLNENNIHPFIIPSVTYGERWSLSVMQVCLNEPGILAIHYGLLYTLHSYMPRTIHIMCNCV